jgi:4-oxalocrotonate tautomerase
MPLVRIDIMEGRPPEMIRELHERVAALVAEVLDTPIERVRTYITQFPPQAWGIGGVPADVSRAAEVEARARAAAERAAGTTAEGTTAEGTTAEGTTAEGTTAEGTTAEASPGSA